MSPYSRFIRVFPISGFALAIALGAILRLPASASSLASTAIRSESRPRSLVAVNSYQEAVNIFQRRFTCVQFSGAYTFTSEELEVEIKSLARQLQSCVQRNNLQGVDASQLVGVIITTTPVLNSTVVVVAAGPQTGNFPPLPTDSDRDGLTDAEEARIGTDANNPDTDGDRLRDGEEVARGTNPLKPDTDGGGVPDGLEVAGGTDPKNPKDDRTLAGGKDCPATLTKDPDKLFDLGIVNLNVLDDYRCARDAFQAASIAYNREGKKAEIALVHNNMGTVDMLQQPPQPERARANFQQALNTYREIGDRAGISLALFNLGATYEYQGNTSKAKDFYTQAIAEAQKEDVANYCRNQSAVAIIKQRFPEITCEGTLRPKGQATSIASGRR